MSEPVAGKTGAPGGPAAWFFTVLAGIVAGVLVLKIGALTHTGKLVDPLGTSPLTVVPFVVGLYVLGAFAVTRRWTLQGRLSLFSAAYGIRLIVSLFLVFVFQYDDERAFHASAVHQMYGLLSWGPTVGYYNIVNTLYAIFGPGLLPAKVLNSFIGSLLPFFVYDVARWMFEDERAGRRALLFTAFLPPLVIFSALALKEVPTAFLLTLTLWCAINPGRGAVGRASGALACIVTLYWLRGAPWAAMTAAGVLCYLALGERAGLRRLIELRAWPRLALVGALLGFLVSPLLVAPVTAMVLHRLAAEDYFIRRFQGSQATVMWFLDVPSALSPKNLVVLFFRGLYAPTPLRFILDHGLDTLLEAIGSLTWYAFVPVAVVGWLRGRQRGAVVAAGVMALAVFGMTSMGVMAGSDPFRQRTALLGLMFALAAGAATRGVVGRHPWVFLLWGLGALVFTGLWIVFRI